MQQQPQPEWIYWVPIVSAVLSVAGSWFGSWLNTRWNASRFYPEKWFDRKVDAYVNVLEALHKIRDVDERIIDFFADAPPGAHVELSSDFIETWYPRWREGYAELKRYTDIGALLFDVDAVANMRILQKRIDELRYPWDPFEIALKAQAELDAVTEALVKVRGIARIELRAHASSKL
jgi:hypothetical protein